jgi:integrase
MARRRANGYGSISPRKDGRYDVAGWVITASGKRKRERTTVKTAAEADRWLTDLKSRHNSGILSPDRSWRLGEYLDHWLEDIVRVNRRPATYAQCEMVARLYLKPKIGKVDVNKLSVPLVQDFLNRMLAEGQSIPKVQVIRKVLSSALTSAQREEVVQRNVARLAVLPTHERKEVTPWTAAESRKFLAAARPHLYYPAFLLLVFYGLRRGEVLGLQWRDIDFQSRVIHIRHQLQRVGHSLELGPVKTKAGRRPLPLVSFVADALLAHRELQESRGSALPDGLVFTATEGKPLEASVLVRAFQKICREHGIRIIRVHDLRHGFATLLKDMGIPVRDAQLLLGHARVTTTQEIYQHDDMTQRRSVIERLEHALSQPKQKSDTVWYRLSADRSRQLSRQVRDVVASIESSISGAGRGTLTPGLILGKSKHTTLGQQLTSVDEAARSYARIRKIGCVAVNLAVKSPSAA